MRSLNGFFSETLDKRIEAEKKMEGGKGSAEAFALEGLVGIVSSIKKRLHGGVPMFEVDLKRLGYTRIPGMDDEIRADYIYKHGIDPDLVKDDENGEWYAPPIQN